MNSGSQSDLIQDIVDRGDGARLPEILLAYSIYRIYVVIRLSLDLRRRLTVLIFLL